MKLPIIYATLISVLLALLYSCSPALKTVDGRPVPSAQSVLKTHPGTRVLIATDSGDMIVRLYDSTPLHRDNFIAKVKEGFYDSLLFHRVIKGFMIQGGDPVSKNAQPRQILGMGSAPGDRIPAEFRPTLFHKKGVLAAARDQNPEKASSNCQFYIVQGKPQTEQQMEVLQSQNGQTYTPEQQQVYKAIGGTPSLDQKYTVYGEVEAGLKVIDKIASVPTAPGDRPVGDVRMHMQVLNKKQYKKVYKAIVKQTDAS